MFQALGQHAAAIILLQAIALTVDAMLQRAGQHTHLAATTNLDFLVRTRVDGARQKRGRLVESGGMAQALKETLATVRIDHLDRMHNAIQ